MLWTYGRMLCWRTIFVIFSRCMSFSQQPGPEADSGRKHSISNSQPEADAPEFMLPFHFAKLMIAILMVLQRQRSGLERERASIILNRLLEIEILYREVVVSVFVR